MGHTVVEKILARAAGLPSVRAGEEIKVKPDFVLAYDFPGYTDNYFRQMKEEFGISKLSDPSRFGVFIDHMIPTISAAEEDFHINTRHWCAMQGVELHERKGIGHQVASEAGYAAPGALIVHFDPHIAQLGTFGALALGIHRNMLEAFVKETITLTVPGVVRVELYGALRPGVMARDVFHHMVRVMGPSACRFQVLELAGAGVAQLSADGLQTITGMAMFTGALSAIVELDQARLQAARDKGRIRFAPVASDPDAEYVSRYRIDLSTLEPVVVVPPSPADVQPLSEHLGREIQVGYLGSCASGRLDDLRIAAQVLKGRKVADGFALNVVPTSQEIMAQATREGLITALIEAGAFVSSPSCDFCYGRIGLMTAGQRAVSTGTLNVKGRMGSVDAEIYLCSAAVVAASAIEGRIADPRNYL